MPIVSQATLLPLVRSALDYPDLEIEDWQITSLSVQGQRRIFRFAGVGINDSDPQPWSIILKEIAPPPSQNTPNRDEKHWAYWPRESLLYQAGIPQSISGPLRAPRCLAVMQPTPDLHWIWLEDLQDIYQGQWPLERYALAAYHLGQFNGSYIAAGKAKPEAPWLTDIGLRSRSATAVANFEKLRNPEIWQNPYLKRAFPQPILPELERLTAERERFLAAVAQLPQTFCHADAWQGNMMAVKENGTDVTVIFDWALSGYGAVGEEIANLVWSALLEFKLDMAQAQELESAIFGSYCQGLADAGAAIAATSVHIGYLTRSVLVFGLEPEAVEHAQNPDKTAVEQYYGWPIERMIAQTAQVTYLLLNRANELRALLDAFE